MTFSPPLPVPQKSQLGRLNCTGRQSPFMGKGTQIWKEYPPT